MSETVSINIREYIEESNRIEGVINNRQAVEDSLDAWNYLTVQEELTHETIVETHRRVIETLQPEISGMYRSGQVYVGDHVPPPAEDVEPLMTELLEWTPETPLEALQWHLTSSHDFSRGIPPPGCRTTPTPQRQLSPPYGGYSGLCAPLWD